MHKKPPVAAILLLQEVFIMERKDLDYLQWLQQNARVYLTGMAILTFLIALSFCLFFSNPWQPQKDSISFLAMKDSDEAVAEQKIPDDKKKQAEDTSQTEEPAKAQNSEQQDQKLQNVLLPNVVNPAQMVEQNTKNADETTKEPTPEVPKSFAVDVSEIEGFSAPVSNPLVYGYGTGYDPIYEDYRFHDHICYQTNGAQVLAATDGIVQQMALEQEEQLTIQYGSCIIIYSGLQSCDVAAGDAINKGQVLGTANEYLYVKATQQ